MRSLSAPLVASRSAPSFSRPYRFMYWSYSLITRPSDDAISECHFEPLADMSAVVSARGVRWFGSTRPRSSFAFSRALHAMCSPHRFGNQRISKVHVIIQWINLPNGCKLVDGHESHLKRIMEHQLVYTCA